MGIKDVAAQAGVSLGTVSNVLNRPQVVRPATRARVEQPSRPRLRPQRLGPAARGGRSDAIAYLLFDVTNPFFTDVARGVEEVARAAGLSLFICNSDQDADREDQYLDAAQRAARSRHPHHRDGLRQPAPRTDPSPTVPVVLVDRAPEGNDGWCTVGVDDVAGGELAITHLLELDHGRACPGRRAPDHAAGGDRHIGARNAPAAAGLPDPPSR